VSRTTRLLAAVAAGVTVVGVPGTAYADPAGPTDFRTTIVSIDPAPPGVAVSVEGGDAFLRVDVEIGRTVEISGYDGEPYLRIGPDGTVERNRRSFATYYNEDRYGRVERPAVVDVSAPADWEVVGTGGAWAWHDHRAHWMGTEPPIGLDPGESLPTQTVPIVVDGVPVDVVVQTTLLASPSGMPVIAVGVAATLIAMFVVLAGPAASSMLSLVLALLATMTGVGQWMSLPAETGRLVTWWLLPALAVAVLAGGVSLFGRSWMVLPASTALAATQVFFWAIARSDGLTRAVLPTVLPEWIDRGVTASALVGSVVVGAASFWWLVGPALCRSASRPDEAVDRIV
jgi:hypothetical protein